MWKELEKWPKTASGLPSTAGTTASIAFIRFYRDIINSAVDRSCFNIRRGKIFIGHVGDSAIILGTQDPDNPDIWRAEPLTRDHKPESLGRFLLSKASLHRFFFQRRASGSRSAVGR